MDRISHSYQLSQLIGAASGIVEAKVLDGKRPVLPPQLTVYSSVAEAARLQPIESRELTLVIEPGFQDPVSIVLPDWLCSFTELRIENRSLASVLVRGTLKGHKLSLYRVNVDGVLCCYDFSADDVDSITLSGQSNRVRIAGQLVSFSSLPDWFESLELQSDRLVEVREFYRGGFHYSFTNVDVSDHATFPACRSLSLLYDSDSIQKIECPLLEKLTLRNVALSGSFARVKYLEMENAAVHRLPKVDILKLTDCDCDIPASTKSLLYKGPHIPELPLGLNELTLRVPQVIPDEIYAKKLWLLNLVDCLSSYNPAGERAIPESNARYLVPPEPLCEYRLATKNLLLDVERWYIVPNLEGLPTFDQVEDRIAAIVVD